MSQIFTAIVGAFIGGGCSVLGVFLTNSYDREKKRLAALEKRLFFIRAIRSESKFLFQRYTASIGDQIARAPDNEPFHFVYIAAEQYFTIYDTSGETLGTLDHEELQEKIVSLYGMSKGTLDTLRLNSKLVTTLNSLPHGEGITSAQSATIQLHLQRLRNHAAQVKKNDQALRAEFLDAFRLIEMYEAGLKEKITTTERSIAESPMAKFLKNFQKRARYSNPLKAPVKSTAPPVRAGS